MYRLFLGVVSCRSIKYYEEVLTEGIEQLLGYLEGYAEKYDLRRHVRFSTSVQRLYHNPQPGRRWVLESSGPDGKKVEEFDYVSINNGHYSDPWIPKIPGLE
jgi:cation diffusion facilitator CzcD-associated flavoprotein CzcO